MYGFQLKVKEFGCEASNTQLEGPLETFNIVGILALQIALENGTPPKP